MISAIAIETDTNFYLQYLENRKENCCCKEEKDTFLKEEDFKDLNF